MNAFRAATTSRALEAVENYSLAEVKAGSPMEFVDQINFDRDSNFWSCVFGQHLPFGTTVNFPQGAAVSEWVARVPGLFWTGASKKLRTEGERYVESLEYRSKTLKPFGKSQLVSGGVGTMRLPPSSRGDRLATIATSGNVSAGIPALITDEVWRGCKLQEGSVVVFRGATWEGMDESWASRFPSTRGIPRGYLHLNNPQAVDPLAELVATEIHPFSIMEYASDDVELFDFVFATAFTADRHFRKDIERFFDLYRRAEGRNGRYLIAADVAQPLWDSDFTSPDHLRSADPNSVSHLRLLQRRIEESMGGEETTEHLLRVLAKTDVGLMRRFSADIGISPSQWSNAGSLAKVSANFLSCVTTEKLPALIDAIASVNSHLLEA